jgi:CheY-like chemotaxis protein
MNKEQTILAVDDSESDVELMRLAFKWANFESPLHVVRNGAEAIDYLRGWDKYADRKQYPMPTVMLLDLNMPKKSGFDVLNWVNTQPTLKRLTVIIFTASRRAEEVEQAFDLGAHSFLVKPPTMDELAGMMRCLRDWLQINHFPMPK